MTAYDDFAEAGVVDLPGTSGTWTSEPVSNVGFGHETGEAEEALRGYHSAWWSYTPDSPVTATIDTYPMVGEDGPQVNACDTKLTIYTGETWETLTEIAYNDDFEDPENYGYWSQLILDLDAETTYYIRVASWGEDSPAYDQIYQLRVAITGAVMGDPAPPIAAELLMRPAPTPTGNDLLSGATAVDIDADGGTYTSPTISTLDLSEEAGEWGATVDGALRRTAWWVYTPLSSGTASIDTELSAAGVDTKLDVFTGVVSIADADGDTQIASDDESGVDSTSSLSLDVEAGTTYYIRVATFDGDGSSAGIEGGYVLRAIGPRSTATSIPPIEVQVKVLGPADGIMAYPVPIQVDVRSMPATLGGFVVTARAPDANSTVPTSNVRFQVAVQQVTGTATTATVQVQYDGTTLSQDVTLIAGSAIVAFTPTSPLSDGSHTWRARAIFGGTTSSWTVTRNFTVAATGEHTDVPVTWTVSGALTPSPHLWFITPAAALPGESVAVVGHGLGASGTVTLAGTPVTVQSWTTVPASGAGSGRVINPQGAVDPEHTVIAITVPETAVPGGVVQVEV